jgi:hypothetical protein
LPFFGFMMTPVLGFGPIEISLSLSPLPASSRRTAWQVISVIG